jgi:hypothetical protein
LPWDPRFAGSNQAKDNGFLRTIKIGSMTSFGGEVKLVVPCREILWHVKDTCCKKAILVKINGHFSPSFS